LGGRDGEDSASKTVQTKGNQEGISTNSWLRW
jgi:hypothetical protein